jgi:hypothetical protein
MPGQRLRERERATWADWLMVARALIIGRSEALKTAKTNRAVGTTYNRAMGEWLRENDMADLSAQARYRAILCIEKCQRRKSSSNANFAESSSRSRRSRPAVRAPRSRQPDCARTPLERGIHADKTYVVLVSRRTVAGCHKSICGLAQTHGHWMSQPAPRGRK